MDVRPSTIAGTWYPAEPQALARALERYLADAQPQIPTGRIWGIVAPHAGLRYSGPVAAWAYACLRGLNPELVAVVGPMHEPARAPLLTTAHAAYATPLGLVTVDTQAVDRLDQALRERLGYGMVAVRDDREHAIEIELPFLQHALGPFRLLPIMIHDQRAAVAETLGHALAATLRGRDALLVASSDLSHYYPPSIAHTLDGELLRRIAAFDPRGVLAAEEEGAGFACGSAAIAAVLWAARDLGARQATVLRYGTSGDVVDDAIDWVVGYGAAALWSAATPGERDGDHVGAAAAIVTRPPERIHATK
jgi:AmmeMemoRadiSam system protein B